MTYACITPPLAEPLALGNVKAHLRIDGAGEDDLLGGLIRVARAHLERATGLALVSQGWRLYLDRWPRGGVVEIARGPVMSIDAVRAFDQDGEERELALTGHVLDGPARPARLWLRDRPVAGQAINGVEVDFTAGFGETGAEVPDGLRRAMLVHAAHMYEFRGAVPVELQPASVPEGYDRLVAPFLLRRI
ncbi:head-tail connector protein [Rhizobium sp.]